MMKIRLEGVAGKRFGYEHELNVRSPNEAIRALCQLLPGFRAFLSSAHEFGVYFQLLTSKDSIGYDHLALGATQMTLVPVITGSFFGSNFGKILLGIALVAFAFTGFGLMTVGAAVVPAIASLGFGLIFSGVAGLFAPGVPNPTNKQEGRPADEAIANAASATAADGTPVPVVYGETLVTRIPVVSSYIIDGGGSADAYWMGVISEGPIVGFPDSASENLYFNGLKGEAAGVDQTQFTDGTQDSANVNLLKFQGFHMQIGTNLAGAGGTYEDRLSESESPNSFEVRSFNNPEADQLRIRIQQQPIYQTKNVSENDGDQKSSFKPYDDDTEVGGGNNPIEYKIELFENGSKFKEDVKTENEVLATELRVYDYDITGKQHPISVRIERLDRGSARGPKSKKGGGGTRNYTYVKGDFVWLSMEVLWAEKLVYPFTSLLACSFKAGAVSRLPGITALIKGRILPIVNRNLSISYSYSRNPANVVLDLLTNTRYGAGQRTFTTNSPLNETVHQPGIRFADIDLASFLKAQKYCDDHDITFDATVSSDADTLELLRSITSTFQGQLVYAGGYITVVIDDEVENDDIQNYRLFTEANVIQDSEGDEVNTPCFVYEGTAKKARTTAVQVSYIDRDTFYKEAKVLVEDRDAMQKYGYNLQKIRALGCTDRAQAKRLARYTLATNIRSTETVSFKTGPEGALLMPGDVCLIGDPLKTRIESGGRIVSATTSQLVVDRTLTRRGDYGDGDWMLYTYTNAGIAQRNTVSSVTGSSISIQGSFSSLPSSNMMWILVYEGSVNNSDNRFNRYRIQKITEDVEGTFQVIAILYDHAKYDYVNTGKSEYGATRLLSSGKNKVLKTSKISFKIRQNVP
jgi:predicted phage tail protein